MPTASPHTQHDPQALPTMQRSNSTHHVRTPTRAPNPLDLEISGMGDIIRSQQAQSTSRQIRKGEYMPRACSRSSSTARAYSPHARPSSPALDRGQVPVGMRLIARDSSGRFDLDSVEGTPVARVGTPTRSSFGPSTPMSGGAFRGHARDASNASSGFNSVLGRITPRHSKNSSTGTTTSSSSKAPLKRPDSRSGPKSSHPTNPPSSPRPTSSRRGSFKDLIRRGSQELTHAAEILLMSAPERSTYLEIEKQRIAEEMRNPQENSAEIRTRELREKLEKKKQREMEREEKWAIERDERNGLHERKMQEYEAQLAVVKRGRRSEDKENDASSPSSANEEDLTPRPLLSSGEKAAFLISKAIDPLKPKQRKMSDDSDMDFLDAGLVEIRPFCDRCGRTALFLKGELCETCHKAKVAGKIERIDDFFEQESLLSSSEDEPSDYRSSRSSSSFGYRPVDEEEYMKTAVDRRIRRVRRTIYDDPGNPFAVEYDDELTVPMLYQRSRDHSPAPSGPTTYGMQPRIEPSDSPASMMIALEGTIHEADSPDVGRERFGGLDQARGTPLPAPRPQRVGTPDLVRAQFLRDRTSQVAEPDVEGYVPARKQWRNSLPDRMPADGDPRDTVFYGFYDSVLEDYRASQQARV